MDLFVLCLWMVTRWCGVTPVFKSSKLFPSVAAGDVEHPEKAGGDRLFEAGLAGKGSKTS